MNFKDEFNKNLRDAYWGNAQMREEIEENFRSACKQYNAAKTPYNQLSGWRKNQMGGRGVGRRGLKSGLCSKNALNKIMKDGLTWDHVIGITKIGETIEEIINKEGFDRESFIKKELKEHLYLWGKIKVTKDEHKKNSIIQNKHTLDQKINFEHYMGIALCTDEKQIEREKKYIKKFVRRLE